MESSAGAPGPETGSNREQEAINKLALDAQELLGSYKKEREAGRDGTDIPLEFLASDVKQLKGLGVLDKYKDPLTKIGADPVIRFAVLSQIDQVGQDYKEAADKSFYLEGIRTYLELGEALGLDQSAGNPDFEDAARLFNDFKEKYSNPSEALAFIEQGKRATSLEEYGELYDNIKYKAVNWSDEKLAQLPPYVLLALISQGDLKPSQIKSLPEDKDATDKNNQILKGSNLNDLIYLEKDNKEVAKMALAALKEAYQIASIHIPDFNPDQPINADDLTAAIQSKREAVIDSRFGLYREENWRDKMPFLGPKKKSDRQTKVAELKQAEDELSRARDLIDIAYSEKEIYKQLITPPEPEKEVTPPSAVQPAERVLTQEDIDAMLVRLSSPREDADRIAGNDIGVDTHPEDAGKPVESLFDELRQEVEATNEASSYRRYFLLFPSSKALQTMTELANILGLPEDARTSTITEMADNYRLLIKRSIFSGMREIFASQPELVERLFSQASPEIQQAWRQFKNVLLNAEPEFSTRSAKLFTDLSGLVDKEAGISDEDMQQSDKLSKYVFEKQRDFRENLLKKEPHVSAEDLTPAFVAFNQAQVAESREKIRLQQVRNSFMDDLARKAGLKSQEQSGFDYPKLVVVESQ